jgi:hypothetical protein
MIADTEITGAPANFPIVFYTGLGKFAMVRVLIPPNWPRSRIH